MVLLREASRGLDALLNEDAGRFPFRSTRRERMGALIQLFEFRVAGADEM